MARIGITQRRPNHRAFPVASGVKVNANGILRFNPGSYADVPENGKGIHAAWETPLPSY
jgi:hypothetical protein